MAAWLSSGCTCLLMRRCGSGVAYTVPRATTRVACADSRMCRMARTMQPKHRTACSRCVHSAACTARRGVLRGSQGYWIVHAKERTSPTDNRRLWQKTPTSSATVCQRWLACQNVPSGTGRSRALACAAAPSAASRQLVTGNWIRVTVYSMVQVPFHSALARALLRSSHFRPSFFVPVYPDLNSIAQRTPNVSPAPCSLVFLQSSVA